MFHNDSEFLSLKAGCTGSSESTLVKMPHCWKSLVMAHFKNALIVTKILLPPYTSYVPNLSGGGHIVFGVDPVSLNVMLSCVQDILLISGQIETKFAWV